MSSVILKSLVCWLSGQLMIRQDFLKFHESEGFPSSHLIRSCVYWSTVSKPSFPIWRSVKARALSLLQASVSICTTMFMYNSTRVGVVPDSQEYVRTFQSPLRSLHSPFFSFKYFNHLIIIFASTHAAALKL